MKTLRFSLPRWWTISVLIGALWAFGTRAHAQWATKWLSVGSLHHKYSETGAAYERLYGDGYQWPAQFQHQDNFNSDGLWFTATNFTDENGETYPVKTAHNGVRDPGIDEVFPQEFRMVSRFEPPEVYVDDRLTFEKAVFNDAVDPNLQADRMIYNRVNSSIGITMEQTVMQFSQQHHDNYHLIEYTFTNTGNVDEDDEIELPDQTLDEVYFYTYHRYAINRQAASFVPSGVSWGRNVMYDVVTGEDTDDIDDYEGDLDFRAYFAWHGVIPGTLPYNHLGAPAIAGEGSRVPPSDSVGRLTASTFVGRITLHADQSAEDTSDDPAQPSTFVPVRAGDGSDIDPFDVPTMVENFDRWITAGRLYPHHADIVQPKSPEYTSWTDRMAHQTADPGMNVNGMSLGVTYGPYRLEPGETVDIVVADAAAGLSRAANIAVGRTYKRSDLDDNALIAYDADGDATVEDGERMTKNYWVLSGRDSLFQTFKRARANYESGYSIATPPLPPRVFRIVSGTDRIQLEWETYPGASPRGFEIYRARNSWESTIEDDYEYTLIAELGPDARSYDDTDIQRGISYFYHILAVGDVNTDPTGMTPTGAPLKSSRFYTQSYDPAFLKRRPGESLEAIRVVPNPFNLAADQNLRWPDRQDKLGFLDIPGNCTIKIYTQLGELVESIEHTDGSGDAYWDLTSSSNQVVVSGVYFAVIEDLDSGERIIRRFVVIR